MKFKIGDKVAVYIPSRRVGIIEHIYSDGNFKIRLNNSVFTEYVAPVHPKQCRLLKKKFKQKVWVKFREYKGLSYPVDVRKIPPKYCLMTAGDMHECDDKCIKPGWFEFVLVETK